MKLGSILLAFFLPIQGILIGIGFAISLDTFTGIWNAVKNDESITSRKLSRLISKTLLYESAIMLFYVMDYFLINELVNQLFSVPFLVTKCVALVLFSIEVISINENIKGITGEDIWDRAKNILSRIKEIKKDVDEIK
ncbi:hypothetical protein [uncultured Mediterranean phage uvMED]|nr:hypothetical protein [uncultured Mediterranean phage uvMED]